MPDLETPDHPYVNVLHEMIDYAVMGIVDTNNGLLHCDRPPFDKSVIIAPVLSADLNKSLGSLTASNALCRDYDDEIVFDCAQIDKYSGLCDYRKGLLNPVIWLPPWIKSRPTLTLGSAVIHEADHAYWELHAGRMFKRASPQSAISFAETEISAGRLERQLFCAHVPKIYDEEYAYIATRFSDLDFSETYKPRGTDKVRKSTRIVAFINFLFDALGGDVGKQPPRRLIQAMKNQDII